VIRMHLEAMRCDALRYIRTLSVCMALEAMKTCLTLRGDVMRYIRTMSDVFDLQRRHVAIHTHLDYLGDDRDRSRSCETCTP